MKWSVATQVLYGASAAYAAATPKCRERDDSPPEHHKPLPLYKFGSFETISHEEAWAGVVKHHNFTHYHDDNPGKYPIGVYPFGGPGKSTSAITFGPTSISTKASSSSVSTSTSAAAYSVGTSSTGTSSTSTRSTGTSSISTYSTGKLTSSTSSSTIASTSSAGRASTGTSSTGKYSAGTSSTSTSSKTSTSTSSASTSTLASLSTSTRTSSTSTSASTSTHTSTSASVSTYASTSAKTSSASTSTSTSARTSSTSAPTYASTSTSAGISSTSTSARTSSTSTSARTSSSSTSSITSSTSTSARTSSTSTLARTSSTSTSSIISSTSTSARTSSTSTSARTSTLTSLSTSTRTSSSASATSTSATCSNPNVRTEWRSYSDSDKSAFVSAIKCLMNKPASGKFPPAANRYEDLVRVHQVNVNSIHGNNIFLPWHRYYVWTFEQILRDECGFDRAFPWWDEGLDSGKFESSPIFTSKYFGSLPKGKNGMGTCITDGAFANLVCHLGPGSSTSEPHCLARAVDESLTAQSNTDFVNTCNSRDSYPDMENCAELGPHAYAHNGIGSIMSDVAASPSDPVFFMHHLFIDRNYWLWQGTNATRLSQIDGCIDSNSPCTKLTLDTVISVNGLRPDVKVRDILNPVKGSMCYKYTY